MLYSSCKATVVDLAKQLDIDVVKAVSGLHAFSIRVASS